MMKSKLSSGAGLAGFEEAALLRAVSPRLQETHAALQQSIAVKQICWIPTFISFKPSKEKGKRVFATYDVLDHSLKIVIRNLPSIVQRRETGSKERFGANGRANTGPVLYPNRDEKVRATHIRQHVAIMAY